MKIVLLSVVRNELDIIEAFVRYHAEIADHIVIADHRSIDGSAELLDTLQREGLPVSVRPLTSVSFNQAQTMTELMRQACTSLDPDFVVLLDADEFLGTDQRQSVREVVAQHSREVPTTVPIRHYVATPDDDSTDPNPITRIVHRRTLEGRTKWKVIVPRVIANDPAYGLSNGNHRVVLQDQRARVPSQSSTDLFIAHYPARSVDQVSAKVVGWFAGRITRVDRVPKLNATKRRIISQLARSGSPPPDWLMDVGLSYCLDEEPAERPELEFDPLSPAPALRYPNQSEVSPMGILADALEEITVSVRRDRKERSKQRPEQPSEISQQLAEPGPSPVAPRAATAPGRPAVESSAGDAPSTNLKRANSRIAALENELEEMRSSASWKLTAPLRRLRRESG